MLSSQTRYRAIAFCLLAVTAHAGGQALGRNAFSEYLLAGGYFCEALAASAAAMLFRNGSAAFWALAGVFVVSGIFAAAKDTLEGAIPPELTGEEERGTVYGTLGAVNGFGDLIASALTGTLWTAVSPVVAFGAAATLMALGAVSLLGTLVRR